MNCRFSLLPIVFVGAASLLNACGYQEVDQGLKAKTDESERATLRADNYTPQAGDGWTVHTYDFETSHPYKNREKQVMTVTHPGATSIKLSFKGFQVENGYDVVKVSSPEGNSAIYYTGNLGDFWTAPIPGPTARIELVTDASVRRYGFKVGGYAAQTDVDTWVSKTFVWHTPHPYRNNDYRVIEISQPDAVRMRILFGELVTEEGYDFVSIYDEVGRFVAEYSGNLAKFETPAFTGKKLYVVFASDESVTATGVSIAEYSYVSETTEAGCFCPMNFDPVCGENGKTYSNACAAGCAATPVKHPGQCGTAGDFCGGIAGLACAEGWNCAAEGNWPDAGGSCTQ